MDLEDYDYEQNRPILLQNGLMEERDRGKWREVKNSNSVILFRYAAESSTGGTGHLYGSDDDRSDWLCCGHLHAKAHEAEASKAHLGSDQ